MDFGRSKTAQRNGEKAIGSLKKGHFKGNQSY